MSIIFDIAANQICGARPYQEDAFLFSRLAVAGEELERSLLVLADGAGGHAAGSLAARNTVLAFNQAFISAGELEDEDLPQVMRHALDRANESIAQEVARSPDLEGMGCTLVAATLVNSGVRWVSVGDSNLCVVRDGILLKLNEDHSYGGIIDMLQAEGRAVKADPNLKRNMLVSAMGGFEIARVDCPAQPVTLKHGDCVILSSDGLNTVADDTIADIVSTCTSAYECTRTLLHRIEQLNYSRQDNATVVVAYVRDPDAPLDGNIAPADMRDTQSDLVLSEADTAPVPQGGDVAFED